MDERSVECAVIGGGAAGLSAALVLGRALTRTLVIDAGGPSNAPAPAVGGLLGFEGAPADLYAAAAAQLARLPDVARADDRVTHAERDGDAFRLTLAGGGRVRAATVILAGGLRYAPPGIPGLAPLWGDTVFHCPFCHGHEVHGRPLALLGEGDPGADHALLLRRWSPDVVLLTGGGATPGAPARRRLAGAGVAVEERAVERLEHLPAEPGARPRLGAIALADGARLPRAALMVPAPMSPRDDLADALGATTRESGTVVVDALGRTDVPGLWAAGDLAGHAQQVAMAIATGSMAGAAVVRHLAGL